LYEGKKRLDVMNLVLAAQEKNTNSVMVN